ncbi:MAG: thiol-disulfide isomerase [Bryobacteraceae bacterium]
MKVYAAALLAATTFHRDVLPILQNRCQECHRTGQIAPMPFATYQQTRPWAKAILEAVLSRKMPPWFADPAYGHFANDSALSKAEIETLASWVHGGAPEGNAAEAPVSRTWNSDWNIGKPDRILAMPKPVAVPASGTIEYQYVILPGDLSKDTWVQKVEVRPGNPALVHHAVVYVREGGSAWLKGQPRGVPFALPASAEGIPNPASFTTSDVLLVYSPGNSYAEWPAGMAKRIKAGSDIVIQFHYTANGKAQLDRTRVGLTLSTEAPKQVVLTLQMGNDKFVIPPGDPKYRVQVSGTLPNEALLLSLFPHMHLRGKAFEYSLPTGNGHVEALLKIDHYDFRWQLNYRLRTPRLLPAGTRMQCTAWFDNSPNNPLNPDPSAEVRFGEQSWQEMMIGFFDVAVDARFDKNSFFASRR